MELEFFSSDFVPVKAFAPKECKKNRFLDFLTTDFWPGCLMILSFMSYGLLYYVNHPYIQ